MWIPLAILFLTSFKGFDLAESGTALSVGGVIGLAIGMASHGHIIDRIGGMRSLAVSSLAIGVSFPGLYMSRTWWEVAAWQAVGVFGGNLFSAADIEAVRRSESTTQRRTELFAALTTVRFFVVTGAFIAGTIGLKFNSGRLFWLSLVSVLFAAELIATIKFWNIRHHDDNFEKTNGAGNSAKYRDVLTNPMFMMFTGGMMILEITMIAAATLLAVYLASFGLKAWVFTAAYVLVCLSVATASYLVKSAAKRWTSAEVVVGTIAVSLVGNAGLAFIHWHGSIVPVTAVFLVACLIGLNVSEAGATTSGKAILLAFSSSAPSGRYANVLQTARGSAAAIVPGVYTLLFAVDPSVPFIVSSILLVMSGAAILFVGTRVNTADIPVEQGLALVE